VVHGSAFFPEQAISDLAAPADLLWDLTESTPGLRLLNVDNLATLTTVVVLLAHTSADKQLIDPDQETQRHDRSATLL